MTKAKWWFSPELSETERREIEERMKRIAENQKDLDIKPTKSGEVGFRPIPLGEPAPEMPQEEWKRERAEKQAKDSARSKSAR